MENTVEKTPLLTDSQPIPSQSLQGMDGQPICAPGLEYLTVVDQLLIKQKIELFEVVTGCETRNRYTIQNNLGQNAYEAKEESGFMTRLCCTNIRPFDMIITDFYEREVIHFRRPLRCDSCICFCCLQEMQVEAPRGTILGYVVQECTFFCPVYRIENPLRETILKIEGPLITCSCFCQDIHFDVLTTDKVKIGKISKLWTGCVRETWTDVDYFRVAFPMNLDVNMKALIISAAFLIDYIHFEN